MLYSGVSLMFLCFILFLQSLQATRPSLLQFLPQKQKEPEKPVVNNTGVFARKNAKGEYALTYYGLMLSGAIARSVAATAVHPLTVIKTMLQKRNGKMPTLNWEVLSRGAGSQFIMSIPHGAFNFAVTETTKTQLEQLATAAALHKHMPANILNPVLDFLSSAASTFVCSVVSTPQMVLTDRIMAGIYPDFHTAVTTIYNTEGPRGFYLGWFPALVQKIPSYALTWMFIQQLKLLFTALVGRGGTALENLLLGSLAAAGACCVMIPVDTIKTRIVTQGSSQAYRGMWQCLQKIIKEEGVYSLYRALPARLLSVVPMIGIQFAMYELIKRLLLHEPPPKVKALLLQQQRHWSGLPGLRPSTQPVSVAMKPYKSDGKKKSPE